MTVRARRRRQLLVAVAAGLLVLAACSSGDDGDGDDVGADGPNDATPPSAATIRVPDDAPTIQAAVDEASPGDLVLVGAGTYRESVEVDTPDITIRGVDRNEVILDGGLELDDGIRIRGVDGVAVENLTVRDYLVNALFWSGVDGYRASYVTTVRNGEYGLYALDSVNGLFEHSYATGSRVGGVYIGQCQPCDAVVTDVVAERNGLGYSGTNAGGGLFIVDSTWRDNGVGLALNSGTYELCYPQSDNVIAGNLVVGNDDPSAPSVWDPVFAHHGIAIAGGWDNLVVRNRVSDHERSGIALLTWAEQNPFDVVPSESGPCDETRQRPRAAEDEIVAPLDWEPRGNEVRENVVGESGFADLVFGAPSTDDPLSLANCFASNVYRTSVPAMIEAVAPCDVDPSASSSSGAPLEEWSDEVLASADFRDVGDPPRQANMPDAATAPARPAGPPPPVDVESISVPEA